VLKYTEGSDIEISDVQNTCPALKINQLDETLAPLSAAEAESEILNERLAAAEKREQGLRAAYECLVEALINATIKVANTEAERDSLSSPLADTEAKLQLTEQERDTLSSQVVDKTLRPEAVLQSTLGA
jgi:chromosome segregation ATPase